MSQTAFDEKMTSNREAYEMLKEQIRGDYAGKYVAIAFGKIVAVSLDFHEACAAIDRLKPAPEHSLVFAAGDEPVFDIVDDTMKEFI